VCVCVCMCVRITAGGAGGVDAAVKAGHG